MTTSTHGRQPAMRTLRLAALAALVVLALAARPELLRPWSGGAEPVALGGVVRTYYVGAVEEDWDYAPDGTNQITGQPFGEAEDTFVGNGEARIGSTYRKCIYRSFTDGSFTHQRQLPRRDRYRGLLGPVLHAAVGDTIRVVFHNDCSFPTTVHPHGVFYTKANEGALYNDDTTGSAKADDAVAPGDTQRYTWHVPPRAGPGPADGSSVVWLYHGHTRPIADSYAGLVGAIVVTARGKARPDGTPRDVDREMFHLFEVVDENQSHYLEHNTTTFATPPYATESEGAEEFYESNLMHTINGFVYGNGPVPTVRAGDRVRWYTFSLGTEVDLHTPHWHGNTVTVNGHRTDVVELLPATMVTADMRPDAVGTWFFHCHVDDHIKAGMQTRYRVVG